MIYRVRQSLDSVRVLAEISRGERPMLIVHALDEYRNVLSQQEKSPKTIQGYLQDLQFFKT